MPTPLSSTLSTAYRQVDNFATLARVGVFRPGGPLKTARSLSTLRRWGRTQAAAYAIDAIRWPDQPAVVDERGTLTFAEVDQRTNALARGLATLGIGELDRVALLMRNGHAFVETVLAAAKLGADVVFLNTSFAGPQMADVIEDQEITSVIYEPEFNEHLAHAAARRPSTALTFVEAAGATPGGTDEAGRLEPAATLEELIERQSTEPLRPPEHEGRAIILTSGTTGKPKGAKRPRPPSLDPLVAFLKVVPIKSRDVSLVPAPMFHSLGYSQVEFAGALGLTLVLPRRFDPQQTLDLIERHRCRVLTVVPVMLKRILDLGDETLARYDCSSLEVVIVSGSALTHDLATRFMDRFGPCLYNLYGATEIGWGTIATPAELRDFPDTVGKPVPRTRFAVLDEAGDPVPQGAVGELFVASDIVFEGYTNRSLDRKTVGELMSVGDLGHVDAEGHVFVDSRADDMIVSGGENVYPNEVERLLEGHPEIEDVAVVGVDDEEFGQALMACVVRADGSSLDRDAVREYVRAHLARFKIPRQVRFMDSLPRSATGKVLKRELLSG